MKATCPKDAAHKTFITSVHVVEEWIVDSEGEYVDLPTPPAEVVYGEVVHGPNPGNTWTCNTCGTEAIVSEN